MKRNWFHRLLLSYLPVLILIVCLFVFISIVQLNEQSRKEALDSSRVYVQNVMNSVDMSLRSIEMVMIESIARNNKLITFAGMESEPLFIIEIAQLLKSLSTTNSLIDSIYVYRSGDGMIITDKTKLTIEQFADSTFIEQALINSRTAGWSHSHNFKIWKNSSGTQNDEQTVISMVKGIPLSGQTFALLVVNVRVSAIQQFLEDIGQSEVNEITLADSSQEILFEQSGYQTDNWDLHIVSEYTGWSYYSNLKITAPGNIYSYITSGWFIFGFFGLLIGIAWTIYITRKNYKPIQTMMSRVIKFNQLHKEFPIHAPLADELSYIDFTLSNIMEVTRDYESQNKVNQKYRRLQLFKELVENNAPLEQKEWEAELHHMGLQTMGSASVSIVEIDKYMEFISDYSRKDQGLFKYILKKVVEETAKTNNLCIWQEWVTNHRLCIIYLHEDHQLQPRDSLLEQSDQVRYWMQDNLKLTVTLGLGHTVTDAAAISHSYESAARALDYKSALGSNRIIGHWEIELLSHDDLYVYLQYVRTIAQAFRVGNESWRDQLLLLFEGLRGLLLPKEEITGIFIYMNYYFYKEMMELPPEYQEQWNREFRIPWEESMDSLETLDELEEFYFTRLTASAKSMDTIRKNRGNHGVVKKVRSYIEQNFSNPDLSLASLSDQFNMNSSSLSSLFKEEFGEKFVVYLCQVRMEHAKSLLRETTLSIQEIAEQVGYLHQMSFIRAFKKMIGTTPGDYRKVHQ